MMHLYKLHDKSHTNEPRHDKTNKVTVRPAKTQISLGILPVWSEESSLSSWRKLGSLTTHKVHSEGSDLTGPQHDKTNKVTVHPAKTQISLGIRPVWSESSLSAWRKLGSSATHWVHPEDWSDWADVQADLSLRWAHSHYVGFITRRLKWYMVYRYLIS